ncbi:hypothetical protein BD769DRAFT_1383432 [Suillus cothurnatus]|nr:hypothetical protein BD769DRAFT_1383432 [Suillus cothurnatus]
MAHWHDGHSGQWPKYPPSHDDGDPPILLPPQPPQWNTEPASSLSQPVENTPHMQESTGGITTPGSSHSQYYADGSYPALGPQIQMSTVHAFQQAEVSNQFHHSLHESEYSNYQTMHSQDPMGVSHPIQQFKPQSFVVGSYQQSMSVSHPILQFEPQSSVVGSYQQFMSISHPIQQFEPQSSTVGSYQQSMGQDFHGSSVPHHTPQFPTALNLADPNDIDILANTALDNAITKHKNNGHSGGTYKVEVEARRPKLSCMAERAGQKLHRDSQGCAWGLVVGAYNLSLQVLFKNTNDIVPSRKSDVLVLLLNYDYLDIIVQRVMNDGQLQSIHIPFRNAAIVGIAEYILINQGYYHFISLNAPDCNNRHGSTYSQLAQLTATQLANMTILNQLCMWFNGV